MTNLLAKLFVNPINIPSWLCLWLIIPLILATAIVYKTVRTHDVAKLPKQIARLSGVIFAGVLLIAISVWLVVLIFD